MNFEWWHWIVLGLTLVVAELAVPAFFVIWFGLGALLVGLALLAVPLGATAQIGLWVVASVAMVGLWFRVFKGGEYLHSRTRVGQSDGEPIGEIGLMTRARPSRLPGARCAFRSLCWGRRSGNAWPTRLSPWASGCGWWRSRAVS